MLHLVPLRILFNKNKISKRIKQSIKYIYILPCSLKIAPVFIYCFTEGHDLNLNNYNNQNTFSKSIKQKEVRDTSTQKVILQVSVPKAIKTTTPNPEAKTVCKTASLYDILKWFKKMNINKWI